MTIKEALTRRGQSCLEFHSRAALPQISWVQLSTFSRWPVSLSWRLCKMARLNILTWPSVSEMGRPREVYWSKERKSFIESLSKTHCFIFLQKKFQILRLLSRSITSSPQFSSCTHWSYQKSWVKCILHHHPLSKKMKVEINIYSVNHCLFLKRIYIGVLCRTEPIVYHQTLCSCHFFSRSSSCQRCPFAS